MGEGRPLHLDRFVAQSMCHTRHDDPRRYGAQTSNLWSRRLLGVQLLLRGGDLTPTTHVNLQPAPIFRRFSLFTQRCHQTVATVLLLA